LPSRCRAAVAVVVDPGGGGEVVSGLFGQQMSVVAEAGAEVGVEPGPGGRRQQQIGLAVAVVVRHTAARQTARRGQAHVVERLAAVLQQRHPTGPAEADVHLAVAVVVDGRDGLSIGADVGQGGIVGEAGHANKAAKVLAAPADEVALWVVIELEAGLEALDLGAGEVQVVLGPSTMHGTMVSLPAAMSSTTGTSLSMLPQKLRNRNGSPCVMPHHSPPLA